MIGSSGNVWMIFSISKNKPENSYLPLNQASRRFFFLLRILCTPWWYESSLINQIGGHCLRPWWIKMEKLNINAVFLVDNVFQNVDSVRRRLGTTDLIWCIGFYLIITPKSREPISRSLETVLMSSFTFCWNVISVNATSNELSAFFWWESEK